MEATSSTTAAAAAAAPAASKKRSAKRLALSQRAVIVTLKLLMNMSYSQVEAVTGVRQSTAARVVERALARGLDPARRPFVCRDEWLADAPRPKRAPAAAAAAEEEGGEEGVEDEE